MKYIIIEGIDGSGKTTQVRLLKDLYESFGKKVLAIKEPGSTKVGEQIRKILLDPANGDMSNLTELLLYYADRVENTDKILTGIGISYDIIISDRGFMSTLAYQGYGRGIDLNLIRNLNKLLKLEERPDAIIYLDIKPKKAMKRLVKRINTFNDQRELDRFESNGIEFFEKVRQGYLEEGKKLGDKFIVVDANGYETDIASRIFNILDRKGIIEPR